MSDQEESVTGIPVPPDENPANVRSGPAGVAVPDDVGAWLMTGNEGQELAEDDAHRRIIMQILSAESPDVVLTPVEAVQARDLIGVPLEVFGWSKNRSEFDAGSPFYATLEAKRLDTGESVAVNCGHKSVIAQMIKLEQFGQWPYLVQFEARGQSAHGTPMLRLVKYEPQGSEQVPF